MQPKLYPLPRHQDLLSKFSRFSQLCDRFGKGPDTLTPPFTTLTPPFTTLTPPSNLAGHFQIWARLGKAERASGGICCMHRQKLRTLFMNLTYLVTEIHAMPFLCRCFLLVPPPIHPPIHSPTQRTPGAALTQIFAAFLQAEACHAVPIFSELLLSAPTSDRRLLSRSQLSLSNTSHWICRHFLLRVVLVPVAKNSLW